MMGSSHSTTPSLWWRLSWQLSLVISAVIGGVIVGLSVYGTMVMSPNIAMESEVKNAVAESIRRNDRGQLELEETKSLTTLLNENSRLWFVAATADGAFVSRGAIPPPYAAIAPITHLIRAADIRGADGIKEIASIDDVTTSLGDVRILFGGVAGKGSPLFALLGRAYPIYGSLLGIALPAIFIAVPWIVRSALARISYVAERAAQIDPPRQGSRLPVEGIPSEVAPLVVAFNGALERLEAEFKKRQRFLIDAAHELRTPIAIMQTRIDGMADGPERTRMLQDVARLADTAEQLLDFERNDQAVDLDEEVDLVKIARAVVADFAPLAIASGYEISFQNEVEALPRNGNTIALTRAIGNLVRNAIDHCDGRGTIEISVSASGEITVGDEGPGIPIEHQELVFQPFYRVTPRSQGAGLGLSLVKQIVINHGGQVGIHSHSGGTRVTVRL
ncbi:HAMP domain-containing histidine kinase [Agrobacterium sp. a22-2]|uniref:sensor histidine kinase n=1 Tax=Agrobacterium sp. a22-2 TaxID=2283840 RepID=UPI001447E8BD|nr:HAMP domain-containing sensor histidine kinase [Agrobacterium sp. a22-2]NKN38975.1 HAMP domain-containing histidine kinase [Agrobacterium sp. a22-2]